MRWSKWYVLNLVFLSAFAAPALAMDQEGLPNNEGTEQTIARDCLRDLEAFEQQLWKVGFGVMSPHGEMAAAPRGSIGAYVLGVEVSPRERMLTLRDAAYVYAYDGDEQACQRELAAMRSAFDEHQELIRGESDDPNVRTGWRRAHLAKAKPVEQMDHLMRANVFIGSEIRNLEDERLGEVVDIVLNPDKGDILYALASRGGFLGLGGTLVPIRWSDLHATQDHELYVLDVSPQAIDEAPAVTRGNFAETATAEWKTALDEYWDGVLK